MSSKESVASPSADSGEYESPQSSTTLSLPSNDGSSTSNEARLYKCGPTEESPHCPPQSIKTPLPTIIQPSADSLSTTDSTAVNVSQPYTATSLPSNDGIQTGSEARLYKCGPKEVGPHCPPHSQTTSPSDGREYFSEIEFEKGNISKIRLGTFSEILNIPHNTVDDDTEIRNHCVYQIRKIADYLGIKYNDRALFLNYDVIKSKMQNNNFEIRLCAYYLLLKNLVEGNRYSDNSKMISNKKVLFYLMYLVNEFRIIGSVQRYHENYDNTLDNPNTVLRLAAFGYAEPLRMYYYQKHEKELMQYAQNFPPICFVQELNYIYEYIPSLSGSKSLKQIFLFVDGIRKTNQNELYQYYCRYNKRISTQVIIDKLKLKIQPMVYNYNLHINLKEIFESGSWITGEINLENDTLNNQEHREDTECNVQNIDSNSSPLTPKISNPLVQQDANFRAQNPILSEDIQPSLSNTSNTNGSPNPKKSRGIIGRFFGSMTPRYSTNTSTEQKKERNTYSSRLLSGTRSAARGVGSVLSRTARLFSRKGGTNKRRLKKRRKSKRRKITRK